MPAEDASRRPESLLRVAILCTVTLAPLPFGSVTSLAVVSLELAAAALVALALWVLASRPQGIDLKLGGAALPVVGIVGIGVAQVAPLPSSWVAALAPRIHRIRMDVGALVEGSLPPVHSITFSIPDTVDALLRFLAYCGIAFATAVAFRRSRHRTVALTVVAVAAAAQALYGSVEYLSGHHHILGYAKKHYLSSATGTFINRNHFASYLAAALPCALAPWLAARAKRGATSWRESIVNLADAGSIRLAVLSAAAVAIVAGLLLSYSRAGFIAAAVGCLILYAIQRPGRARLAFILALLVIPATYLSVQQVRPPGDRFVRPVEEYRTLHGRVPVWKASLGMLPDAPLLGTGFGTFEDAFALYQPPGVTLRFDHAHNDWLQALVEGGILAPLLWLWLLAALFRRAWDSAGEASSSVALAALAAIAFHAIFDFPMRIPALAVLAAFLVGLLLAAPARSRPIAFRPGKVRA